MRLVFTAKPLILVCFCCVASCDSRTEVDLLCEPAIPCSDTTLCCNYVQGPICITPDEGQATSLSSYCSSVCRVAADCLGETVCAYRDPLEDACTTSVLRDNVGECFDVADVPAGALVCGE